MSSILTSFSYQNQRLLLTIISIWLMSIIRPSESIRCEIARVNCALRNGCGFSLRNYMMECTDLIAGRTQQCNPRCERALIGLISSDEGKDLIDCDCDGNKYCQLSKQRIEVCRKSVYSAVAEDTIVSCSTARWICVSDQLCRTALEYYQLNCRALFQGHKCTHRCNNSLSILDRQDKAIKLRTCYCDGTENFPCRRIKYYTERMCYGRHSDMPDPFIHENDEDNFIETRIVKLNNRNREHHNNQKHHLGKQFSILTNWLSSGSSSQWSSANFVPVTLMSLWLFSIMLSLILR